MRLSGEPLLAPPGTLICSPLRADVTLPVANVAISGALTSDALTKTPETSGEPASGGLYHIVLEPLPHASVDDARGRIRNSSRWSLARADILGAISGVAIPGGSMVPYAVWQAAVRPCRSMPLDRSRRWRVLVGLSDARDIPAMRTGNELWLDRLEFAAANIAVSADCNASPNWVFLPFKLPPVLLAARAASTAGSWDPCRSAARRRQIQPLQDFILISD